MRLKKHMRKILLYPIALLSIWIFLAQCMIMKERWSDKKAYSVFKSKQVPLQMHDTVINDSHLHYAVSGNDSLPTLVFVHGSPGTWMHYMKFMWDSSLRKKFRIIAIDRPGFGYSSFGKAMHLQQQSNMILPVLKKLKTNKPMFLVGHSMGAPVSVKMAADNPTLFKTIVIVAGALDISQEKPKLGEK